MRTQRDDRDAELNAAKEALARRTDDLARTKALMRAILESVGEAVLVTDAAGTVLDLNQRFLRMWGISDPLAYSREPGQVLRQFASNFADPEAARKRIEEIYAACPEASFEIVQLEDGRIVEQSSRLQLLLGERVGRVWSFRDVTVQKRTENALREETRVLELIHETGALLASQLDLQALLQAATDATTKLSGAQYGAFFYISRNPDGEQLMLYTLSGAPREAFDGFGHPRATPVFGPTFRGEGVVRRDDITQDPLYGQMPPHYGMPKQHLPVRSYLAVPVKSRSGEPFGGLFFGHSEPGVFTARSERIVSAIAAQASIAIDNARLFEEARRSASDREALLEAERKARAEVEHVSLMKDEFLATLSHELRTPLNAVLGWADILLGQGRSPEDQKRGLSAIARNARAQAQLIDDLLDMSRIVAGKVRLEVQPTELSWVVDAALDAVKLSADAKQIKVRRVVDPRATAVGDPNRLQQVIWNLLSNAVKFTPKGGNVQLTVARVESVVEIRVTDSGAGISAEFLPHVFERFRQADASTTRQHGGLGLGLAIVKQLVELHGGSVRAESEGENRGATFVVTLPLGAVETERPSRDRIPILRKNMDLTGVRIVVVDDDADARELIGWVLSDAHANVATAGSADEAVELVRRHKPHVLVSDIGMPKKDGYELISEVRALPPEEGGRTPAIALTAFARSEDRTQALLAGFQLHLSKPVEPSELLATVASLAARTMPR